LELMTVDLAQFKQMHARIAELEAAQAEVDALRKWLDQHCAPTVGEGGEILSLIGRVQYLIDA
jgi:hypothetical protein